MDKNTFLDILRQSLTGVVAAEIVEQNIRYYNQYIDTRSLDGENEVLEELGDPRLIAKTIIESNKAAKQKGKFNDYNDQGYETYKGENYEDFNNKTDNKTSVLFTNLTWRQKVSLAFVLIVLIIIIIFVGRIIIGFLFAFGVPILLVLLIMALFKKR